MPTPTPSPNPPIQVVHNVDWVSRCLSILAIALVSLQIWFTHNPTPSPSPNPTPIPSPTPTPAPTVDMVALGRSYASKGMASTWGDAMNDAATSVEGGADMATVQTAMQTAWDTNRTAAFNSTIGPQLAAIIPAGGTVDDPTRAKIAKAFRDLAAGAKSVK